MFDPRDWLFGKSTYKRGGGVTAPKARRRPPTRLAVEVLEDRVNPSSFNWTGAGGDNLWENPANWDQIDHLPTIDDSASIATANAPIVNQQGNIAVGFLMDSTAYDLIIHGNLTVGQGAMISGRLVVDGSVTAASGIGNTISADSLDLAGQIHLAAGSQLSLFGTTSMLHTGAAIDGDGTLNNFGTLAIDGDATVNNLTDAGNLAAPGVLTITGTMNWQAGALAKDAYGNPGTLDIAPAAALNIAGSTTLTIDAWTINDYGTINWTGGDVNNADSTVNIASGASFTITADGATWHDSLNDGGSTINNAGTLTKAAGTMGMPVTIEAQLNSSGHIGAEIGEISLKGGGSFAGLIDIRGTASVVLANGVFLAEGFAQVNGQGQGPLIVDGSTSATLNFIIGVAPVLGLPSVTLQNVELRTDGLISGPGTLEISRQLIWSGGVMNGTGTTEIAAGALMAMKGNVAAARPIVNRGITGLLDGKILSLTDCTFSNFGELTAQGGTMIAAATAATRLRNEAGGHITKALQGTANFVVPVVNDGSIDVTQGELRFTVPSQHGQDINIQVHSDATLRFRRLAHTFGQGASIFGAGQLIVDMDGMAGTTLNFGANTSVAVADFQMNGAANRILGSAIFACGEYHLNGGAIAGTTSVQVSPEKEMEVSGGLSLIDNASIRNYGTIHWVADNITTASNAAITNDGTQGEGIFSIETASQLLDVTPDGQPTAVTLKAILGGTISVAPATGNVTVQALLVNDQGELNLNGNHLTLRQRDGSV
ncbi:MAG: hypothetical protein HYR84_01230, partial [Planctomycetes bacterium]|nr:hypothetical protein [Planctomycetota bacterium]